MTDRTTDRIEHMTPAGAAAYWERNYVGQPNGDPIQCDMDRLIVGYLSLILNEIKGLKGQLKEQQEPERHWMDAHRDWLLRGKDIVDKTVRTFEASRRQMCKRIGISEGEFDSVFAVPVPVPGFWLRSYSFKTYPKLFWSSIESLRDVTKCFRSIQSVDDLLRIPGFGKVKLRKIKELIGGRNEDSRIR